MRENIVPAQHYPFPLRNKAYADQAVMKMTSEVDNNIVPLLGPYINDSSSTGTLLENESPR